MPSYLSRNREISSSTNLAQSLLQSQLNKYQNQYYNLRRPYVSSNLLNNSYTPSPYYNYQIVDNVYYPMQTPIAQSFALPKIQVGRTVNMPSQCNNCCNSCNSCCNSCNNNGLNIKDLITLFSSLPLIRQGEKPQEPIYTRPPQTPQYEIPYRPPPLLPEPKKEEIPSTESSEDEPLKRPPPQQRPPPQRRTPPQRRIPSQRRTPPQRRTPSQRRPPTQKKKTPSNIKKKIPNNKSPIRKKKDHKMRDWWILAKNFTELYVCYRSAMKYARYSKTRNKKIKDREKKVGGELNALKEWIISIEQPFWNEFKVFKDLNLSYKNTSSKMKIAKETQKIKAIIQKFVENLIHKTTKLKDIPEVIQKILYNYIKERAYFPKKFLTTNQIYRLDFHFYGGTRMVNDDEASMILSFLIINAIVVQLILLHIGQNFAEFKGLTDIEKSAKYIGSIIHYLTRDTFKGEPKIHKIFEAVLNYYRNYHEENEDLNACEDIFGEDMIYKDKDEVTKYLIPYEEISEFWELNKDFVENYKKLIHGWATHFCQIIKGKYAENDPDLKPRKRMKKPPIKTMGK